MYYVTVILENSDKLQAAATPGKCSAAPRGKIAGTVAGRVAPAAAKRATQTVAVCVPPLMAKPAPRVSPPIQGADGALVAIANKRGDDNGHN